MQLVITRSQDGQPVTFAVRYQLSFSPTEQALYDRYGLPELLRALGGQAGLDGLLKGAYSKSGPSPAELRKHEEKIRGFCEAAADFLRDAVAYQGSEAVSFDTTDREAF